MIQQTLYTYLGQNGTLVTPIYLENIYSIKKIKLVADENKMLTKDGINFKKTVIIPAEQVQEWYEVTL